MQTRMLVIATALALIAAACGQTFNPPPPIDSGVTVHADPAGDAGSAPTFDVIDMQVARGASELQVRLWTAPEPAIPAPGTSPAPTQFSGGIGFNTDLNVSTGAAFVSPCGGSQGIERFVDLTARNADGSYNVRDAVTLVATGTAAVSQDGPRVTFTVPFGALGTGTGRTMANAIVGIGLFVGKDCVPDAGEMLPTLRRIPRHPLLW